MMSGAEYLLGLVLTNPIEFSHVSVPSVADHRVVQIVIKADVVINSETSRTVWLFKEARWDAFRNALRARCWGDVCSAGCPGADFWIVLLAIA